MSVLNVESLADEIEAYWDERSTSYSNGVQGELSDDRRMAWQRAIDRVAAAPFEMARLQGRPPRVLDLGCGPGFFSVLFGRMGCEVDAIDMSAQMIERARANVEACAPGANVRFHHGDIIELPFDADTFDLAISRNVTWLLRDPKATYAEWLRVLRTSGKLVAFDANWYRYLVDPAVDAARRAATEDSVLEGWDEDAQATSDEEKRCEEIARELPMTYELRPAWDLKVLAELGAAVRADEDAWQELWTENEKSYYAWSPMFLVEAVK